MKRYLVFIVVLLSNLGNIYACGYYPYGEDVRYRLFLPENFDYQDFTFFNYNAGTLSLNYQNKYESNVQDWYNHFDKKVALDEIEECMNRLTLTDIHKNSTNQLVQYLFKNDLQNVIEYLIIAKNCEAFNTIVEDDLWERNETPKLDYDGMLSQLNNKLVAEKSAYLKRKYAFITIRVAFYGGKNELLKTTFDTYFAKTNKDYLYYWALFFTCFQNENASVNIANIMAYSSEKKYASYYYFHSQFNLKNALSEAKTPNEIANIYAYASVQRLAPNLDYLKEIYKNSSQSRILDFLLLREINKIEDWVYTPYYTNFIPSVDYANYWWNDKTAQIQSTQTLRAASEKDRLYAKQVLDFIESIDYSKIKDISLWKAAEIQLLFITRNYKTCLSKIADFQRQNTNEKILTQIEKIKAMCIISNQEIGHAVIKEEVKPIMLKYKQDPYFLFAMGRELEFRKNIPDGLALNVYGNKNYMNKWVEHDYSFQVQWQGNRLKNSGNLKYFYDYFDYLDFVYSADELQLVINKLNAKSIDDFSKTLYSQLLKDKNYLTDLLGTKYIRENRLTEAEKTYASLDTKYWDENYNPWERDKFKDYYTFDKNPFYDFKHTESFIPKADTFIVTKLSVTQHLIKYLKLANDPKTKDRDYYYFISANCYLNMTQYGHSWMMRRYNSTTSYNTGNNESYIDEIEYRNGDLAQKYYHLAFENAKTDKFKALCIRMEEYASKNIDSKFKKLKSTYPEYYDELSNCYNFGDYFMARR
jgi:hypothetical protein